MLLINDIKLNANKIILALESQVEGIKLQLKKLIQ